MRRHGHTAAEVISQRANAELPFMGLTVFSSEQPAKDEVGVAKNYLAEEELATLSCRVSHEESLVLCYNEEEEAPRSSLRLLAWVFALRSLHPTR